MKRTLFHTVCSFCGRPAKVRFKTGLKSWCCERNVSMCPAVRRKSAIAHLGNEPWNKGRVNVYSMAARKVMSNVKMGKKLTKEHRRNIGISLLGHTSWSLGKKHSEVVRKKISASMKGKNVWMKGRKQTEEANKKRSYMMKGRLSHPMTESIKTKLSFSLRKFYCDKPGTLTGKFGAAHPAWRGIGMEPYCDAWSDQEYKKSIRERDGYICQNPECFHQWDHLTLTIHHVDYNKKDCAPWNLISLCRSCNSRANGNRNYWMKLYQGILLEKYNYNNLRKAA